MEPITSSTLHRYRNFHLWMLIPFAISILGFSYSYYSRLSTATFHQHVHGISATLWYILVIIQPYLIARKQNVRLHIIYGTIGLMIAGIVAGSAYTIIPKNIDDVTELKDEDFFNPTFAYFATLIDFVLISMFVICVGAAILSIKKKRLTDHVQWLMASVFFCAFAWIGQTVRADHHHGQERKYGRRLPGEISNTNHDYYVTDNNILLL